MFKVETQCATRNYPQYGIAENIVSYYPKTPTISAGQPKG